MDNRVAAYFDDAPNTLRGKVLRVLRDAGPLKLSDLCDRLAGQVEEPANVRLDQCLKALRDEGQVRYNQDTTLWSAKPKAGMN